MVTDLVEICRLSETKRAENLLFRRYLSAHHHRIEPFQILAAQIQEQIDCTACANCCRHSVVTVTQAELDAMARHLGCTAGEVTHRHTERDPDSHRTRILRTTQHGCAFLRGNLCTIYDASPNVCRDFPHVALNTHSLGSRFSSLCRWAAICPIIYNALESYKHLVGYHSPPA